MVQCAYGSEPKPTSPAWFTYPESDISAFLPGLAPFVTYGLIGIPSGPQNTADFCSVEPTGDLPTALDYILAGLPNPFGLLSGTYGRLGNQVKYDKFAELCQCKATGVTGACVIALPTNLSWSTVQASAAGWGGQQWISNHGSTVFLNSWSAAFGSGVSPTKHWRLYDGNGLLVSDFGTLSANGVDAKGWGVYTAPIQPTILDGQPYRLMYNLAYLENVYHSSGQYGYQTDQHLSGYYALDAAETTWTPWVGHVTSIDPKVCTSNTAPAPFGPPPNMVPPTGYPPAPAAPTCGTYQDICNFLQTLDNKINLLSSNVQAIQRFPSPVAYTLGRASTGLTGRGTIAASGILGALVLLTTVPNGWGASRENPRRLIPTAVSIQAHTPDGYSDWYQVHYEQQLVQFTNAWATSINYNVREGFVATITPILAPL